MELFLLENVLAMLTGSMGIIVISSMLTSIKSNKLANSFLIIVFLLVCSRFLIFGTFNLGIQFYLQDFPKQYKILLLLIFPCQYLYYKTIIEDQKKTNLRNWLHFVFPAIYFTFYSIIVSQEEIINKTLFVQTNYTIILIFLLFYIVLAFNLLRKKLWIKETEIYIDHYKLIKNWTIFLFSASIFLFLRFLLSISFEVIYKNEITGNHYSYIIAAFVWLLIFIKILISPEILLGLPKLSDRIHSFSNKKAAINKSWKIKASQIKNEQDLKLKDKVDLKILMLIQEIDSCSENKHFFRNPKVTIADLAREIGVPASYIVYLYKYHSKATFLEYKTNSRIEDAIKLIEKGYLNSNTLESLASTVGFASYNPFFTAFKKSTGLGPNEFFINSSKQNPNFR